MTSLNIRSVVFILALILVPISISAQTLQNAAPTKTKVSSEKIAIKGAAGTAGASTASPTIKPGAVTDELDVSQVSGTATYIPISSETTTLSNGSILQRVQLKTVIMTSNPKDKLHMSMQTCNGVIVTNAGRMIDNSGYCHAVDRDGDVWSIWYDNGATSGAFGYIHGTGKFSGISGGGTSKMIGPLADGSFIVDWEGNYE